MRINPTPVEDAKFDMTPMMDIVFQLIAFFMIVAAFVNLEKVAVDLPIAENAAIAENTSGRLNISITADATIFLGSQVVTLDELADRVVQWQQENPQGKVLIRGDRGTRYASIKEVMKICREAGLSDIIFSSLQSGS